MNTSRIRARAAGVWFSLSPATRIAIAVFALILLCSALAGPYYRVDRWLFNRSMVPINETIKQETEASRTSESNANTIQAKQATLEGEVRTVERVITIQRDKVQASRRQLDAARQTNANAGGVDVPLVERQRRLCSDAREFYADVECSDR